MSKRYFASAVRPYIVAFLSVAAAASVRFAVDSIAHDKAPFLIFAFAIVVAALYGGFRAGVTATVLSVLIGDYLFVEPRYTWFVHDATGDSTMLLLFSLLGIALSVVIERLNRANERERQSRKDLSTANAMLEAHELSLELANERFRMAVQAANEAIWEWNVATATASWSDLYSERFGRPPAETSLEWWFEQIHPEDRERVRASFFAALNGSDNSWVCEYRMLRADGTWANNYDRGSISRSPNQKALRVVGATLDVTEIRRAQEELERRRDELAQSNDDLQRFAFVVSHDLKAPLRMIEDHSRRLASAELDEEQGRIVRAVVDGAGRMRSIIDDLLEFARLSSQPAAPEICIDSNVIFGLTLQHLQSKIRESHAHIAADRLPVVMMNENRLLRVFQNLIGNALQYCEQTPQVYVSARRDGNNQDMWLFSVRDNGIGIPPEYHERVFGMFERLHSRDRFPGTGLGLAIVKRIVESYGGRIWVESEAGKGSTFYFSLHAADDASTAHHA
jgi:PAS domain S-box-containing protein